MAARRFGGLAWVACFVLVGAARISAADEPGGGDAKKPQLVGSASIASVDRLSEAARAIGLSPPGFLTAQGIEQNFPFIGAGGLDTTRPLGVLIFAGPKFDIARGEEAVFAFPVKPGAASLDPLLRNGGQPVPGHDDAVQIKSLVLRRAPDHLMFSTGGDIALTARGSDLEALYAKKPGAVDPQPLARLVLNPRAFLAGCGEQFKGMMKASEHGPRDPAGEAGYRLGQQIGWGLLDSFTRFDLELFRDTRDLRFAVTLAPLRVSASAAVERPGLPEAVVARVDLAFATAPQVMKWAEPHMRELAGAMMNKADARPGPGQEKAIREVLRASTDALLGGKALTLGIVPRGENTYVYVIQRHDAATDIAARLRALADSFNKTGRLMEDNPQKPVSTMDTQSYTEPGGMQVTRLRELESGKPNFVIDGAQKGNTVFLCVSGEPEHHLGGVVDLPAEGALTGIAAGSVRLDRMLAVVGADMPKDRHDNLAKLLRGKAIDLTARPEGEDAVTVSLSVPEQTVADFARFVTAEAREQQ